MTPLVGDLTENREIYIPYLTLPVGGPRQSFAKMFSTEKTRMIGLPYTRVDLGEARGPCPPRCQVNIIVMFSTIKLE